MTQWHAFKVYGETTTKDVIIQRRVRWIKEAEQ
jgi:hypothetical protein